MQFDDFTTQVLVFTHQGNDVYLDVVTVVCRWFGSGLACRFVILRYSLAIVTAAVH